MKLGAAEGGVACTVVADRGTRVMASPLPPFLRDVESFLGFCLPTVDALSEVM